MQAASALFSLILIAGQGFRPGTVADTFTHSAIFSGLRHLQKCKMIRKVRSGRYEPTEDALELIRVHLPPANLNKPALYQLHGMKNWDKTTLEKYLALIVKTWENDHKSLL